MVIAYIAFWFYQTQENERKMAELENQIIKENENIVDQNEELDEEAKTLIAQRDTIDFDQLYEINSDSKGWLKVDALELSYPIMQSTNNQYYLSKNIEKEDSIAGSIYLDYRNHGFEDKSTVIYGHNMKNDSMFGKLDEIGKGKCGTDIDIMVYTKEKIYKYQVFSTYEISPQEFDKDESMEIFLRKSKIDFQKEVNLDTKCLTLYTCTNTSGNRTIVHAYLEREIL